MKKLLVLLFTVTLLFVITACSSSNTETTDNTTTDEENTTESADAPEGMVTQDNILVAYFSATGNTASVANMIADALDCAEFSITPTQPYSEEDLNYDNPDSRVSVEHNNPERNVEITQVTPDGWENYDTVFIGYPIWWGEAAYPVDTFVKGNNFDGKTVVPFCTSGSSDIGQSAKNLESLTKTGNWLEGKRFPSDASTTDVDTWLKDIGYTD